MRVMAFGIDDRERLIPRRGRRLPDRSIFRNVLADAGGGRSRAKGSAILALASPKITLRLAGKSATRQTIECLQYETIFLVSPRWKFAEHIERLHSLQILTDSDIRKAALAGVWTKPSLAPIRSASVEFSFNKSRPGIPDGTSQRSATADEKKARNLAVTRFSGRLWTTKIVYLVPEPDSNSRIYPLPLQRLNFIKQKHTPKYTPIRSILPRSSTKTARRSDSELRLTPRR